MPFSVANISQQQDFVKVLKAHQQQENAAQFALVPEISIIYKDNRQSWTAGSELQGVVKITVPVMSDGAIGVPFPSKALTM